MSKVLLLFSKDEQQILPSQSQQFSDFLGLNGSQPKREVTGQRTLGGQ